MPERAADASPSPRLLLVSCHLPVSLSRTRSAQPRFGLTELQRGHSSSRHLEGTQPPSLSEMLSQGILPVIPGLETKPETLDWESERSRSRASSPAMSPRSSFSLDSGTGSAGGMTSSQLVDTMSQLHTDDRKRMMTSGGGSSSSLAGTSGVNVSTARPRASLTRSERESAQDRMSPDASQFMHASGWVFVSARAGGDDLFRALSAVGKHLSEDGMGLRWIGWPGAEVPAADEADLAAELQQRFDCTPVWMSDDLVRRFYYHGYCKRVLWPRLHYRIALWRQDDVRKLWRAYVDANQQFANQVVAEYRGASDVIWVNDYHLLLVPGMLRRRLPEGARIGLFLHAPFPTSEVFKTFPERSALLQGMLGADIIAFHSFDYSRHFTSAVTRVLGLSTTPGCIVTNSRIVQLRVLPGAVDHEPFLRQISLPSQQAQTKQLAEMFKEYRVIIGVDNLDFSKGVPHKLEALDMLFRAYPEWRGKIVLIQVCAPPRVDYTVEQGQLDREINELVGRINGAYGSINYEPVHYLSRRISLEELVAIYRVADLALITSIRDGLNLMAQEFVLCQDKPAPLVLSEFTGSARSLPGAMLVNPFNLEEVANSIDLALRMPEAERLERQAMMRKSVLAHSAGLWGRSFVSDIRWNKGGEGNVAPPRLAMDPLVKAFASASRKLLLLDYDGTLVPLARFLELAGPSEELIDLCETVQRSHTTNMFVVSGRPRATLSKFFTSCDGIGFVAEHGYFIRYPGEKNWTTLRDMQQPDAHNEGNWRDAALKVFQYYEERTPGSFVEEKEINLTWHYRLADPVFGEFQAHELSNNLHGFLDADILVGKRAIEVRPRGVNKGTAVTSILAAEAAAGRVYDFVLCIGDDQTDEDMFQALQTPSVVNKLAKDAQVFTVTVGKHVSSARCHLPRQSGVIPLLEELICDEEGAEPWS